MFYKRPLRPDELFHNQHKYIAKIGEGKDARYFYSQEELDAYKNEANKKTKLEDQLSAQRSLDRTQGWQGIGKKNKDREKNPYFEKGSLESWNQEKFKKNRHKRRTKKSEVIREQTKKAQIVKAHREKKAREKYGHTKHQSKGRAFIEKYLKSK